MASSPRLITLRLRGTGRGGILVLVAAGFGLFGVPRLLSHPPSPAGAEVAVRELWGRQVRDAWLPQLEAAGPDSAARIGQAMARDLAKLPMRLVAQIQIRRSWIGPPFARRWAYFVKVRESPTGRLGYYRISRGLASTASETRWRAPLF